MLTTPSERTRALRFAEELMRDILSQDKFPDLPDDLRHQARAVLRHYPDASTRKWMVEGEMRKVGTLSPPLLWPEEPTT